jgi:hypothetical protein
MPIWLRRTTDWKGKYVLLDYMNGQNTKMFYQQQMNAAAIWAAQGLQHQQLAASEIVPPLKKDVCLGHRDTPHFVSEYSGQLSYVSQQQLTDTNCKRC